VTTLAQCETSRSGGEDQHDYAFRGTRVFSIPHEDMAALRSQYIPHRDNVWPDELEQFGVLRPYLTHYTVEPVDPVNPGHSLVTCEYNTPLIRWPEPSQPIRGVLQHRTLGQAYPLGREPTRANRLIQGISDVTAEAAKGVYQKVVSGEAVMSFPRAGWVIRALAVSSYSPSDLEGYVGKVNSNSIFFGHGPPGTIRYEGSDSQHPVGGPEDQSFWRIDLNFAKKPEGWTVVCKKFQQLPVRLQVKDSNGVDIDGAFRDVLVEKLYSGTELVRDTCESINFSVFQQILQW
jgi:hypothetical protein